MRPFGVSPKQHFFVVPDVWLTTVGRDNLGRGLIAALFALLGALSGGVLVYFWGVQAYHEATTLLLQVPAIDTAMLERVRAALQQHGTWAIVLNNCAQKSITGSPAPDEEPGRGVGVAEPTPLPGSGVAFHRAVI